MNQLQTVIISLVPELQTPPRLTPAPHILRVIHRIPKPREFALGSWRMRRQTGGISPIDSDAGIDAGAAALDGGAEVGELVVFAEGVFEAGVEFHFFGHLV